MQDTGFFGFMWRFNAIAVAAAAVAVVLGALLIGVNVAWWFFFPRVPTTDTNLVSGVGQEVQAASYHLSFARMIPGTTLSTFYLSRTNGKRRFASGGSYEPQEMVNILLVDGATAKGRWLFDGVARRIDIVDPQSRAARVSATDLAEQPRGTTALWLVSRAGAATAVAEQSPATLLAYSIADSKLHTIVAGIDDLKTIQEIGGDLILIVYEIGEKAIAMTVSGRTLSVMATNELPRLEVERAAGTVAR